MLLFVALIFFLLLIIVHEYGHFIAAKRNGVEVEEFGIGFPPKIAGKTFGRGIFRSYYTLNWLPLGGFVKLKGENSSSTEKGSFGATSFWVKTKIILAGVFMNFIVAILIFTYLAGVGMPTLVENQYTVEAGKTNVRDDVAVAIVDEETPAAELGLIVGDVLVSMNEVAIVSADQLFDVTESFAGQNAEVVYIRDGETFTGTTKLNDNNDEKGYFGVGPADIEVNRYSLISAIRVGIGTTVQLTVLTLQGLAILFTNLFTANFSEAAETVSGPVGIVVILSNITTFGFIYLLYFIGVISLTLAIFNALPIPALDGGRLFITGLFKVTKRPLTPQLENRIHGTGFAVLMVLILLVTMVDINRFF